MKRFSGFNFLITGGSAGIGLATAQRLAAEGARVALVARDPARLQVALASLPGPDHVAEPCDATDEDAITAVVQRLHARWGPLHGAVLCAGAHQLRPLAVAKAANYSEMFRANVLASTNVIRPLVRTLAPGQGSIVVLSSVAGLRGASGASPYAAAKGALLALVQSLASELSTRRARINAVVPGVVATAMTEQFLGSLPPAQKEAVVAGHPLGLGRPEDVAGAIAFLLSDDARWMTGSALVVDGGLSCH